jgi:carbonic anhydrase
MASSLDRCFLLRASMVVLAVLASTPARAQSFGYFGALGPAYWSQLSPDWGACNSGEIQSPVDLGHQRTWRDLAIDYGTTTGEIFNNGHTIEVETEGDNRLMLDGVTYDLVQFHFHTGSEHRVLGRGYDMELHLVHKSAAGTNAVIGVFLKRGTSSGALAPILAELPDALDVKEPLASPFNPSAFLPSSPAHYRYVGSLTTPPCTEGVRWLVLEEPVTVSDEDIAQFAERIRFNARYVQRRIGQFPGR